MIDTLVCKEWQDASDAMVFFSKVIIKMWPSVCVLGVRGWHLQVFQNFPDTEVRKQNQLLGQKKKGNE